MEIIGKKEPKYNPLKLPKALDFHLMSQELPLPRDTKARLQVSISKMSGKKLKETIEYLEDMRYTAANNDRYKLAAYCKAVKEFVEMYYKSTKAQGVVGDKY